MNRDILVKWLEKALALRAGEKLFLVAETKVDRKQLYKAVSREIDVLKQIDPTKGWSLKSAHFYKDGRHWVEVERISSTPLVGFVKGLDGRLERVEIGHDSERWRRLKLMKQDGLQVPDIEEIEGELTDEERYFIEGGK